MVRLTPKRSPSESSGSFAPGSSACSMIARRSARQITLTLSDDSAVLLVGSAPPLPRILLERASSRLLSYRQKQSSAPIACSLALRIA